MTVNAFIFSWDENGVESIVPITQYENWDASNTFRLLADQPVVRNPLNSIMNTMLIRARVNSQRHYEIYAIDCDPSLDADFWREQWESAPQATADLVRKRGEKIYCNRRTQKAVIT